MRRLDTRVHAARARAARRSLVGHRLGDARLARDRDLLPERARRRSRSSSRSTSSSATRASLSFGQISFVAVGACAAGVLTDPARLEKPAILPDLFRSCATTRSATSPSLALAAAVGGVFALLVGLPLMRLSGLAAGHRDVRRARDHAQHPARVDEDRPGRDDALARARDDRPAAGDGRRAARRSASRSPTSAAASAGSCARRVRIPPQRRRSGSACTGSGSWAFTLSGALCGLRRRAATCTCSARSRPSRSTSSSPSSRWRCSSIGGVTSLWGAVVGALAVSGLDSLLGERRERDRHRRLHGRPARQASRLVILGALMALMLILRPSGHHRRPRVLAPCRREPRPEGAS